MPPEERNYLTSDSQIGCEATKKQHERPGTTIAHKPAAGLRKENLVPKEKRIRSPKQWKKGLICLCKTPFRGLLFHFKGYPLSPQKRPSEAQNDRQNSANRWVCAQGYPHVNPPAEAPVLQEWISIGHEIV